VQPFEQEQASYRSPNPGEAAHTTLPHRRGVALATTTYYDRRMDEPTLELYMTAAPITIEHDQPLSRAHELMREHTIRHLPVLEGGALVGLVSLGDLHLMETLDGVDPREATVGDAMRENPYTASPCAPLRRVAAEMAARRISSAVVVERDQVVGIFTTVDGLRGLSLLLEQVSAAMR
jgi:acetoin utilization protein AcuB